MGDDHQDVMRGEILRMPPDELDVFLNRWLMPYFVEYRMGTRDRHCSVNQLDAGNAKEVMRKVGFKFKCAEGESGMKLGDGVEVTTPAGFLAAFYRDALPIDRYEVCESSEELAVSRSAALAIVEHTDFFLQALANSTM